MSRRVWRLKLSGSSTSPARVVAVQMVCAQQPDRAGQVGSLIGEHVVRMQCPQCALGGGSRTVPGSRSSELCMQRGRGAGVAARNGVGVFVECGRDASVIERRETTTIGTPASSISVAMKCRRSCSRNGRSPAARRWRRNALVTLFGFHAAVPPSSLNTNPSDAAIAVSAYSARTANESESRSTTWLRLVFVVVSTGRRGLRPSPRRTTPGTCRSARCAIAVRGAVRVAHQ